MNKIKGKNIILISLAPWYIEIGSNSKDIAVELAKNNRVLYVNRAMDRLHYLKQLVHNKGINSDLKAKSNYKVKQIDQNLWTLTPGNVVESIQRIKSVWLYDRINMINNKRLSRDILKATNELKFNEFILFNDNDFQRGFYLKELLKPEKYIYYIRDYLIEQPYFNIHGKRLEAKLIEKSDLTVANSQHLANYAAQYQKRSYNIGQGCDLTLFRNAKSIKDLDSKKNTQPVIGYLGALNSNRLDIELIGYIARTHPAWKIVLVGPEDGTFANSSLHALNNIYFTGSVPPEEAPQYIASFDVCINPQVLNSLTLGNYPRKVDEYLSLGKPVVSLKTDTMELFKDHVYLANSNDEFVSMIEDALKENNPDSARLRTAFAYSHTWEESVRKLEKALIGN